MRRFALLLAVATAALAPAAANAAMFTVTFNNTTAIGNNNAFKSQLGALGLTSYATTGATITLNAPAEVIFELVGAESGYNNKFTSVGIGGPLSYTENKDMNNFPPNSPLHMFTQLMAGGPVNWTFNNNQSGGASVISSVGSDGFGIFLPVRATASAGVYHADRIYFSFDDQSNNPDDNHDDFLIRATAVPEPATWAMMIAGFGAIGMAARRRSTPAVVTA